MRCKYDPIGDQQPNDKHHNPSPYFLTDTRDLEARRYGRRHQCRATTSQENYFQSIKFSATSHTDELPDQRHNIEKAMHKAKL